MSPGNVARLYAPKAATSETTNKSVIPAKMSGLASFFMSAATLAVALSERNVLALPASPPYDCSSMLTEPASRWSFPLQRRTPLPTTVAGIPSFVDLVIIVDDASTDGTAEVAQSLVSGDELASARPQTISFQRHTENRGVGASIVTGYRAALGAGADVIAVMAADAQIADHLAPLLQARTLG